VCVLCCTISWGEILLVTPGVMASVLHHDGMHTGAVLCGPCCPPAVQRLSVVEVCLLRTRSVVNGFKPTQ